jgi:hypothetical protein
MTRRTYRTRIETVGAGEECCAPECPWLRALELGGGRWAECRLFTGNSGSFPRLQPGVDGLRSRCGLCQRLTRQLKPKTKKAV